MDGWETRRRRTPGFDWCIIRLGLAGRISGVVVDTSYFKGNYPEHCSLEAVAIDGHAPVERLIDSSIEWTEILPHSKLQGDSQNPFTISDERALRTCAQDLSDGGVARLRVYGEVLPTGNGCAKGREIEWRQ